MNNLTTTLLGSVALAALTTAPAMAAKHHPAHPAMHVTALHAGKQVNKSRVHQNGAQHITYTFGVYTYYSASSHSAQNLAGTFYKWNSYSTLCSAPAMKIKAPKKSTYGKIKTGTETYSFGCPSGATVFYGDIYTNKSGSAGQTDTFVSTLTGKFRNSRGKYKGTLNLDVFVFLD